LNIRSAVRAVVLDDDNHLLLVRFEFPTATVWALPGGGLDEGEDPLDGLRREFDEELGLTGFEIGPHIWNRLNIIPMDTGHDGQHDQIHLVKVDRFDPVPSIGWEAMRAERVHEIRWWSVPELEAASDTTWFAPRRLAELARGLIDNGPPSEPIDTGV
jgi:8-oxo-dGTP diphosphatase